jgi:hypothetical protein
VAGGDILLSVKDNGILLGEYVFDTEREEMTVLFLYEDIEDLEDSEDFPDWE